MPGRASLIIIAGLLLAALAGLAYLYPITLSARTRSSDTPFIERARQDAALLSPDEASALSSRSPVVMKLRDRTCVELRTGERDGAGDYLACYDDRNGRRLEERLTIGF